MLWCFPVNCVWADLALNFTSKFINCYQFIYGSMYVPEMFLPLLIVCNVWWHHIYCIPCSMYFKCI